MIGELDREERVSERGAGAVGSAAETAEENGARHSAARCSDGEFSPSEKKCIASAMNILVYASNTERRLREKLLRKGYSPEDVDTAVDYCKGKGYVNDLSQLSYTAQVMSGSKLYGKRRLVVELYKKGFRREDIAQLDYDELEIDFAANCAALLCRTAKLYTAEEKRAFVPDRRIMGAMVRYGYSVSEVKDAVSLLHESED